MGAMKNKLVIWYASPESTDTQPLVIAIFGPFETLQEVAAFKLEAAKKLNTGEKLVLEYLMPPDRLKTFA